MQFNAGVQPLLHFTDEERTLWGEAKVEEKRQKREAIAGELQRTLKAQLGLDYSPSGGEDQCVCKFMVDRGSMLSEIQEYAIGLDEADPVAVYRGEQQTRFNHLIEIKDGGGIYIPVYFFFPLWIQSKDLVYPIFVGSAPRLVEELQIINERLQIEKSAKLSRMPDFLMADEEQIEDYEYAFGSEDNFWERFTFVLMKKLAEKSIEKGLPVILDS